MFNILAPTWNGQFELLYGSYSVSDIQHFFEYIINKNETVTKNPNLPIKISVDWSENRNRFRIKAGYYFELLTPDTL